MQLLGKRRMRQIQKLIEEIEPKINQTKERIQFYENLKNSFESLEAKEQTSIQILNFVSESQHRNSNLPTEHRVSFQF